MYRRAGALAVAVSSIVLLRIRAVQSQTCPTPFCSGATDRAAISQVCGDEEQGYRAGTGLHVLVQAADSCEDGNFTQYFLDVQVIDTIYSDISGLPSVVPSGTESSEDSNSNSEFETVRLDYGRYSNCSNEGLNNSDACTGSCGPRPYPYTFEAGEEYVLYADALGRANESRCEGGLQGIQASGVLCTDQVGTRKISRTVCGKSAMLGVSSGYTCSKNLQFPSKTYVTRLECACSEKQVCGARREGIVIGGITAGLFVLSFAGRWLCMRRRQAHVPP